jgi:hypothetical protein
MKPTDVKLSGWFRDDDDDDDDDKLCVQTSYRIEL